jgi:hypothetical protein
MSRTIMPSFSKYNKEGAIIGRLLVGYGDLELSLLNCVQVVRGDFDAVLKTMFRVRGETNRINIGDALGRFYYAQHSLEGQFTKAIGALRGCLKIRNQYSHCVWWDNNTAKLAFANLEEVAKQNVLVGSLKNLTVHHVDVPLLETQEEYFVYTNDLIGWINQEGQVRAGKASSNPHSEPKDIPPPALHL